MSIVRFQVGEDTERSLVKLNQKLQSHFDRIPAGVSQPIIKPRSIDDVPVLALSLHGPGFDHLGLRRIAAELVVRITQVPQVAETRIIGGARRQIRVQLDPQSLAARGLSPQDVAGALAAANRAEQAGVLVGDNAVCW
jgi:multidrug efflux pump subunit AcrB